MTEFHNLVRMMEAIATIHDLGEKYGLPQLGGTVAMRFSEVATDPLSYVANMTKADQETFVQAVETYTKYASASVTELAEVNIDGTD